MIFKVHGAGLLLLATLSCANPQPPPASIVRPEQSPQRRDLGCGSIRVLLTSEQTGGALGMVEGIECERGTGLHRHPETDETFYVVEGTLTVYVETTVHHLGPGAVFHVPRGTPHAQGNQSSTPVKVVTTFVPAGFEGALRERVEMVERGIRPGTAEFQQRQDAIRQKYDIEPLGPSPLQLPVPRE
jgi:quercetin dioxygenase-like cupin family protein